ncbi:MAG: YfhO family protein [Candidatus Omnitrophica bacterium]|nr:YfhO family protein [Candidatus Omnitrophota bacterium]
MPSQKVSKEFILISILLVLIIAPYYFSGLKAGVVLGSPNFDIPAFFAPIRDLGFDMLTKGQLPLWNPYIFCGIPLLAESQLALFYPFNLVHIIFSISAAINFLFIFHQALGCIFMYLYLRHITQQAFPSLIGSLVFGLSSAFIPRIFAGHLTVICSIAWLPLLFLLADRYLSKKNNIPVLFMGIILSLQILAGHIQFVFISFVGLFLYTLFIGLNNFKTKLSIKNSLSGSIYLLAGSYILAIGLSAVQLIPTLELLQESMRFSSVGLNYTFSMSPENIITPFIPGFFGWMQSFYWGKWYPWEVSFYVGILPLLISLFAMMRSDRYNKFFTFLFFISVILSLGAYLPPYKYLSKYMAGFNLFRAQGRFLALAVFSLSCLTALGLKELSKPDCQEKNKRQLVITVFFAFLSMLFLFGVKIILEYLPSLWNKIYSFIVSYDKLSTQAGFNFGYLFTSALARKPIIAELDSSIVLFLLSTVIFFLCVKRYLKTRMAQFLIFLLIIIDLSFFAAHYFSFFPLEGYYLDRKVANYLKHNIGQGRILSLGTINRNAAVRYKIPSIGGYSGVIPKRYNEFMNLLHGASLQEAALLDDIRQSSPLLKLLNTKFIVTDKIYKTFDFSLYKHVFNNNTVDIYEAPFTLPRVFIVRKALFREKRDDIFKILLGNSFDFTKTAILEGEGIRLKDSGNGNDFIEQRAVVSSYLPNKVVVNAEAKEDGYLVLCDNYYPGWKAYVDGKKAGIFKADYIFRAVYMPKGRHTIEFVFSPFSFKLGLIISLAFLILCLFIFLKHVVKKGLKGII